LQLGNRSSPFGRRFAREWLNPAELHSDELHFDLYRRLLSEPCFLAALLRLPDLRKRFF
jgi:hypothetical protein